jgi:hypothetical protein
MSFFLDIRSLGLFFGLPSDSFSRIAFLAPYPSDLMSAYPISLRVNSSANSDEGNLEPV